MYIHERENWTDFRWDETKVSLPLKNYNAPLTKETLCAWQAAFFPTGFSEGANIDVGRMDSII